MHCVLYAYIVWYVVLMLSGTSSLAHYFLGVMNADVTRVEKASHVCNIITEVILVFQAV